MKYIPLDAFERINSLLQGVSHQGTLLTLRLEAYTCRHTREERRIAEDILDYHTRTHSTPPLRPAPAAMMATTATTPVTAMMLSCTDDDDDEEQQQTTAAASRSPCDVYGSAQTQAVMAASASCARRDGAAVTRPQRGRGSGDDVACGAQSRSAVALPPPPLVLGSSAMPLVCNSSNNSSNSAHDAACSGVGDGGGYGLSGSAHATPQTAAAAAATATIDVHTHNHNSHNHNIIRVSSVDERLVYFVAALNHLYGDDGYDFAVLTARDFVCHDEQTLRSEVQLLLRDAPEHCAPAVRQLWPVVEAHVGDAAHGCVYYEFCCPACDPTASQASCLTSHHYLLYNKRRKVLVVLLVRVDVPSRVQRRRRQHDADAMQARGVTRMHDAYSRYDDDDEDDDDTSCVSSPASM